MCNTSVTYIRYMIFESYNKRPMQMNELKLRMINDQNPYLMNAFNRNVNHTLNRKYSHIPFPK